MTGPFDDVWCRAKETTVDFCTRTCFTPRETVPGLWGVLEDFLWQIALVQREQPKSVSLKAIVFHWSSGSGKIVLHWMDGGQRAAKVQSTKNILGQCRNYGLFPVRNLSSRRA